MSPSPRLGSTGARPARRRSALVDERTVVAIGHAVGVHAEHVATIGHQVDAIALDGGRGTNAQVHLVEIGAAAAFAQLGHRQLPNPFARGLVEAQQQTAAGGPVARIVQGGVVGADEDLAVGHHGAGIVLRAQFGHPANIEGRADIDARTVAALFAGLETDRQALFVGGHVPGIASTPLRPIPGQRGNA